MGSIDQIESLNLPKRTEKRRTVYMGENIEAQIQTKTGALTAHVVDLSFRGMAVVTAIDAKTQKNLQTGEQVSITMKNFHIQGVITHRSQVHYSQKSYVRFGIKFHMEIADQLAVFYQKISHSILPCKGFIKPQAYAEDPFFFSEQVLFQVLGFSSKGIELELSARTKTILPDQSLPIHLYLPGRGTFSLSIKILSVFFVSKNESRYRIYGQFLTIPKECAEALTEYLLMFGQGTTLETLKSKGFSTGNLTHALTLTFTHDKDLPQTPFQDIWLSSAIAMPKKKPIPSYGRKLLCHLGPEVVGQGALVFVDQAWGHESLLLQSDKPISSKKHLELVEFRILKGVSLGDFLMFFLQQIIRIGAQASYDMLLFEGQEAIWPVLEKMGFEKVSSSTSSHLYRLIISFVLENKKKQIHPVIWDKVYKDLYRYLNSKG